MPKKFNKKMLIPILTLIALLLKQMFNLDIPDQVVDIAADIVMYIVAAVGYFWHPHVTETPTTGGQPDANTQYTGSSDSAV